MLVPRARPRGLSRCRRRAREMKTAAVIVALVVALALQTTLAGLRVGGTTAVNLVLVVVVYVGAGVRAGDGLLAGTVGGLMQDALAGGIIGIGGLSKTLVGFVVGVPRRAVHRLAAAAAVRDVRGRDGAARGLLPGAVRAGRGAAVSAASIRRCSRRRSSTAWSASSRSCSSSAGRRCCSGEGREAPVWDEGITDGFRGSRFKVQVQGSRFRFGVVERRAPNPDSLRRRP